MMMMMSETIYAPIFMAQYVKKARVENVCSEFHVEYTYFLIIIMCPWAVSGRHVRPTVTNLIALQITLHKGKRCFTEYR
jgi:hypothetical protein